MQARELQIHCPDGQTKNVRLEGDRLSLGRSSVTELCFPDDAGLSRQHLAFEREGSDWIIRDLGSKNGTLLNGARLNGKSSLKPGDRITAGHLVLVFDDPSQKPSTGVIFFEGGEEESPSSSTVITNLEGLLVPDGISSETTMLAPAGSIQVSALIRAGNELGGQRPLPELFRLILDLSIQAVGAERGVLMTLEGDQLVMRAAKGDAFRISTAVRDRVLNEHASVLVRDTQLDDAFRERRSIVEQRVRTLMAVPLQTKDRIIGLIYIDSPSLVKVFTKDDLNLLTVMANVAAIRIEHARLAEVEHIEKMMHRELEQAAEIQRRFLPAIAPEVPGLDLAGHNAACRTVGGDYYDFFSYPNGRVAMVLGDVSGKGMPASLLMMSLQARVQVLIDEPEDLAHVMSKLNRLTAGNCPSNRFVTLFFCVLDSTTGEMAYCNAGHNPPFLVRKAGNVERLSGGGTVLGILPDATYEEMRCRMDVGDLLVIYSDGVTEANNPSQEEFEEERLEALLAVHKNDSAQAIVEAVNRAIAEWAAGSPPADDITLIVAKRTG